MSEVFSFQIAGHVLSVVGDGVGDVLSKVHGFIVFRTDKPPQWEVAFLSSVPYFPFEKKHSFELEHYSCIYGCANDTDVLQISDFGTKKPPFRLIFNRGGNRVEATQTSDPTIMRFALWFAFNLLGIPHGLFAIHSSTVVCQGKANLFLGESGTGKSTHTRLWLSNIEGAKLLNDDSPIISIEGNEVVAYGSPWSGKTPCYHNVAFPVNAFVRLRQEKTNNIHRLSVFHGFAALQPSTPPAFAYSEFYSPKMIGILDTILHRCPVYQLDCLPDADAARLSFNTLYHN